MEELDAKIAIAVAGSLEGLSFSDVRAITTSVLAVLQENNKKPDIIYKVTSDRSTAVSPDTFWLPMHDVPVGVKMQLHTKDGVAVYSTYTPSMRRSFIGWHPCPKRPDWLKAMLSPYYNNPAL